MQFEKLNNLITLQNTEEDVSKTDS